MVVIGAEESGGSAATSLAHVAPTPQPSPQGDKALSIALPLPELMDSVGSTKGSSGGLTFRGTGSVAPGNYSPLRHSHMVLPGGDAIPLPHSDISALSDIHRLALLETTTATMPPLSTGRIDESGCCGGHAHEVGAQTSHSFSSWMAATTATQPLEDTMMMALGTTSMTGTSRPPMYMQGSACSSSWEGSSLPTCTQRTTTALLTTTLELQDVREEDDDEEEEEGKQRTPPPTTTHQHVPPPATPPPPASARQRIKRLLRLNLDDTKSPTVASSSSYSSASAAFSTTKASSSNTVMYVDGGSGMTILQTSDGDIVRYENVRRKDGKVTAHIKVAQRFAIGSKGMYTYPSPGRAVARAPQALNISASGKGGLNLSTSYPPTGGLIDDSGDNLLELGFLGRGAGSVEVVKALHFPSMKMVAVKKVPIDDQAKLSQAIHELEQLMTNQVTIRERIADDSTRVNPHREASITAKGHKAGGEYCPFIVSLYDAYKHQAQLRLVMEYMNGGSLQDLVDKGGSNDEELLAKVAYNILRGLHYLHRQGKIHRDIKPGNLLINTKNFVKIADFGLAASLDRVKPQTVGTNRYIPPELLDSPMEDDRVVSVKHAPIPDAHDHGSGVRTPPSPSTTRWSTKGDIWSFGLSLWAIAEGKRPFDHVLDDEILIAATVIDDSAPRVSEGFSPEFRDFVDKCLLKNPVERHSAEQLLQHAFIRSKAYVHLNERELEHAVGKVTNYFQTHPGKAMLTPAMVRSLAEEVHLDEQYVGEHLRDALVGVPFLDGTVGAAPLSPPGRHSSSDAPEGKGNKKDKAVAWAPGQTKEKQQQPVKCCVVM